MTINEVYFYLVSGDVNTEGPRILIKGEPGIGKSTFVYKLLYDWATNIFRTFSLVFIISLKLVGRSQPIENIIIEQTPPLVSASIKPAVIKALLKNNKKVLLILDGYDEMSENARASPHLKQLLHSELYGNICLILTSRPQMISDIERHFTTIASIEGFSKEKAELFVKKFFPDDPDTVQAIMDFTGRSGIRDMWRIPILLLFICVLVDSKLLDISPSANVAMNTIYDRLIECVFRRHFAKKGKVMDKKKLDGLIAELVSKFGQIAFECLTDGSNLCSASDIRNLVGPDAFEYGLIIGSVDRSMMLGDHDDLKVSFLHRSLQEYLAARYVGSKILVEKCHMNDVLSDNVMQDPMGKYMLFSSFLYEMMSSKSSVSYPMQMYKQNPGKGAKAANDSSPPQKKARLSLSNPGENSQTAQNEMVQKEQNALLKIAQESISGKEVMLVTGYEVTPTSSHFVMNVLKNNTSLMYLTFDKLNLKHCLILLFASQLPSLQRISFSKCTFQESMDSSNTSILGSNPLPSLQGFILDDCIGLSSDVTILFGNCLRQCDRLSAMGIYNCKLKDCLVPLVKGTYQELEKLCFYNCDFKESPETSNTVSISMEKMEKVKLQLCTLDLGAYRLLSKCMSTSKRVITLKVLCKGPKDLDPALFCGELRSVDRLKISHSDNSNKKGDYQAKQFTDQIPMYSNEVDLNAGIFHGSLPVVREVVFVDMIFLPSIMQSLASSLQHSQVPFTLIFNECNIIDGLKYLGQRGVPAMQKLVFHDCNLIDNPNGQERVQKGGFPSLPALMIKPHSARAMNSSKDISDTIETMPISKKRPLKIYNAHDAYSEFCRSYDTKGSSHLSNQSICILCKCISMSSKLTVLKIPMTGDAVNILVDNDLPAVVVMELYVLNIDEKNRKPERHALQEIRGQICSKRFQNLKILNLFPNYEQGSIPEWVASSKEPPPCKISLQSEGWRQFFLSLAGNRSLQKCVFDSMDLTGCLSLFLAGMLDSLDYIRFECCKLMENISDLSLYTGNLPHVCLFYSKNCQHADSGATSDNCALRILCACLAGNSVLEEFIIIPTIHDNFFYLWSNSLSQTPSLPIRTDIYSLIDNHDKESPQVVLKDCLSALFQMPLPRLRTLKVTSCVLVEAENNTNLDSQENLFPELETVEFSGTTSSCLLNSRNQNSGMKVLAKAISGSPYLKSIHFKDIDCSGCLSFLLAKDYPRLVNFSLEGCIVGEEEHVQLTDIRGNLPRVSYVDLSTCKHVANSAAQILFASLGGGDLASLKCYNTDLTGCLSLLLRARMYRLSKMILKGCTLSENTLDHQVTGYLPVLNKLNLKNCKTVSASAVAMLLQAVSGSNLLTSISIEKVDFSTSDSALFTHDLPGLTHLVLEDCILSDKQIDSFMRLRKRGFFSGLKFLCLNGTRGLSGWFSHATDGQESELPCVIVKGGFQHACTHLWVLSLSRCGLTNTDIGDPVLR